MMASVFGDEVFRDTASVSGNSRRSSHKGLSDGVCLICALISILNAFIVRVMIDGNCEGVVSLQLASTALQQLEKARRQMHWIEQEPFVWWNGE